MCRVYRERLSSWPHSCKGKSNQLSRGVVLSQSPFYLVIRHIRHCPVPYHCLFGTNVASLTSFISVAIAHTVNVSRLFFYFDALTIAVARERAETYM